MAPVKKPKQNSRRRTRGRRGGAFYSWQKSWGFAHNKTKCRVISIIFLAGLGCFIYGMVTFIAFGNEWEIYGPILIGVGGLVCVVCLAVYCIFRAKFSKTKPAVINVGGSVRTIQNMKSTHHIGDGSQQIRFISDGVIRPDGVLSVNVAPHQPTCDDSPVFTTYSTTTPPQEKENIMTQHVTNV